MQIVITHGGLARSRVLSFNRLQITAALGSLIGGPAAAVRSGLSLQSS